MAEVAQLDGTPPDRIAVIPNGVDIPEAASDVCASPAVGLMVANLDPHKGHHVVLEALRLLDNPPRIIMVGEGPERTGLDSTLRANGLEEHVELRGSVPEAALLWRDAQFGIHASYEEGLPNAVMEAMAYGVPVVATAVGGTTELIEDDVSGLLVRPGDAAALARAIRRLATDPQLRVALGARAHERPRSLSWVACTDRYDELYRAALAIRR